jgi:hypothetical protein
MKICSAAHEFIYQTDVSKLIHFSKFHHECIKATNIIFVYNLNDHNYIYIVNKLPSKIQKNI